ncbi:MAG: hypothetical protein JNJ61_28870 [Anaerolineae bacterium]|nr:hypothetical protein [Anaerolineae bacterium]
MRWIAAFIVCIIVSVLVGIGLALLDRVGFYLVLLMPLIGGMLIGFAAYFPTIRQKVATAPLLLIALIGCLVAQAVYWGGQYISYQDSLVSFVQEEDPSATREEALELLDLFLQEEYGATGFMGFVQDYAATGVQIGDVGSGESDMELKGNIAYGFFGLEALLMIIFAFISVFRRESNALVKRNREQTPAT